jgi:metallo-beta-lactamase family protein
LTLRTAFSPRDAKTRNLNLIACGRIDKYAERSVKVWVGFCQMRRFNRGALTPAPTPMDVAHRPRLTPEAVTHLDWHNEMSKLVLDISDQVEAAADDRARGVIIRRLKRALKGSG